MNSELIATMTERIVSGFKPVQILLFGSYARGDAHPQSDVDLLVVFSECANKRKLPLTSDAPLLTCQCVRTSL